MLSQQLEYVRNLDKLEVFDSVVLYTGEEGYTVNRRLREGGKMEDKYQKIVDDLDTAFLGVPPIQSAMTVYRSIDVYVNFTYRSEGYISTSIDITASGANKPIKGAECCVIEITIPSGSKVLPLTEVSKHPHEKEILLPRNGRLLFISETIKRVEGQDYVWLYATYAPPDPNFKIKNVRQVTEKQLKVLGNIFNEERLLEIVQETKDFDDTFDDFKVALRVEVATSASNMKFISGISDTFTDSLDLEKYRKMFE